MHTANLRLDLSCFYNRDPYALIVKPPNLLLPRPPTPPTPLLLPDIVLVYFYDDIWSAVDPKPPALIISNI